MNMELTVTFPGGKKVNAEFKGFTIKTDQSPANGGEGTAPSPFDLFLASIGTCSGVYVLDFCANRGIPLEKVKVTQQIERDSETHLVTGVTIRIDLPADFPDKYREGLVRAVDLCTVKKHIMNPPKFTIEAVKAG
ncbi:MAG: OsmC family protein [Candidatus Krumholzibacteriaceae bacterium]|jgi:ribosomal protein S12 methylthiotransferase accessory factor